MKNNISKGVLAVAIMALIASTGFARQTQLGELVPIDEGPRVARLQEGAFGDLPDGPTGAQDDVTVQPQSTLDSLESEEDLVPEQSVIVNEKYAGWEAAGEGSNGERISDILRANWVMTDANGRLDGAVSTVGSATLENMQIYLLNKGRVVTSSIVNEDGTFEFTNVIQGPYSLVGVGPNAFFAFGLNIIRYTEAGNQDVPKRIDVAAFQNKTTINHDWIRYFAPNVKFRVFGRYSAEEGPTDPANHYGTEGLANYKPVAAAATSINNHQVAKVADGRFLGRVHQFNSLHGRPVDLQRTRIMLLQNDGVVASASTDNHGVFEIPGVEPGEYALVAAGTDGLGTIGITIVEAGQGTNPYQTDAEAAGPTEDAESDEDDESESETILTVGDPTPTSANVFDFTLASAETVGWLNHYAIDSTYRRAILAPREPYRDPDADEGGYCHSCAGNGCNQCGGSGRKRGLRNAVQKVNGALDRFFYPDDYGGRPCNNCPQNGPAVGFGGPLFSADGTPVQQQTPNVKR